MAQRRLSDGDFSRGYDAVGEAAIEEFLKYCRTASEVREVVEFLIQHRRRLRDFEVAQLRRESEALLERWRDAQRRLFLEEVQCFKDVLALQRRLLVEEDARGAG